MTTFRKVSSALLKTHMQRNSHRKSEDAGPRYTQQPSAALSQPTLKLVIAKSNYLQTGQLHSLGGM